MKNIRLKGYDYGRLGAYFITICVKDKHEILGEIHVGAGSTRPQDAVGAGSTRPCVELTDYGKIVKKHLIALCIKFPHISFSNYVIMPNHIHCIIHVNAQVDPDTAVHGQVDPDTAVHGQIDPATAVRGRVDPAPTLGQIVGYFKYQTTKEIGFPGFWQRSYHDHIIRNDDEYQKIYQYIDTNPTKWSEDRYYIRA